MKYETLLELISNLLSSLIKLSTHIVNNCEIKSEGKIKGVGHTSWGSIKPGRFDLHVRQDRKISHSVQPG